MQTHKKKKTERNEKVPQARIWATWSLICLHEISFDFPPGVVFPLLINDIKYRVIFEFWFDLYSWVSFCLPLTLWLHIHTADVRVYSLRQLAVDLESERGSGLFMRRPWHFPSSSLRLSQRIKTCIIEPGSYSPLPHPSTPSSSSSCPAAPWQW